MAGPPTSDSRIPARSNARMLALQALCVLDAVGDDFLANLPEFLRDETVLADLAIDGAVQDEIFRFAQRLTIRTWTERAILDQILGKLVPSWSVTRMPAVDRNILRMSLCEFRDEAVDRPAIAIIDEAADLARRFGDTESPTFVNGVLDAAWHDMHPGAVM